MSDNELVPYREDIKNKTDFIPFYKIRQTYHLSPYYPVLETSHFLEAIWDEELQHFWDYGTNWYQHFTPKGQIPHLFHKSNNEKRSGEDFHNNPDIVTGGCSVTTPVGIPHNFGWPEIIRHITGKKVNNVSHSGASTKRIIYNIFGHITKYGEPKEIHILLPELTRVWLPQLNMSMHQGQKIEDWTPAEIVYHPTKKSYVLYGPEHKNPKLQPYIHKSFDGHKTLIPLDMVIEESLRSIDMLTMYCEISNIQLKMFSWDSSTDHTMQKLDYKNYVEPPEHLLYRPRKKRYNQKESQWGWPSRIEPFGRKEHCCELQPVNKYQKLMWDHGLDENIPQQKWAHPGLHAHIHIADIFLNTKIEQHQIEGITPWYTNTHLDTL